MPSLAQYTGQYGYKLIFQEEIYHAERTINYILTLVKHRDIVHGDHSSRRLMINWKRLVQTEQRWSGEPKF